MLDPLTEPPLLLDNEEMESTGEDFLVSSEDDKDNPSFVPPVQTLSSPCLSAAKDAGEAAQSQPSVDMHNVCKRAARRLGIPWPTDEVEASWSHAWHQNGC